jgi:pyridoxamine 5'-phosphate oxidase
MPLRSADGIGHSLIPNSSTVAATEPLEVVQRWLNRVAASGLRRNPNSMALATVGEQGRPAVRMVLLKEIVPDPGYVVFYTHYNSRKGRELEHSPTAAGALYWEEFGQQVRLEGRVLQSPHEESDAYFASRPFLSQLNAWVSAQSEPLDEPESLLETVGENPESAGASKQTHRARPHRARQTDGY